MKQNENEKDIVASWWDSYIESDILERDKLIENTQLFKTLKRNDELAEPFMIRSYFDDLIDYMRSLK